MRNPASNFLSCVLLNIFYFFQQVTYLTTNFEANELKDHYEFKFAPTEFTLNAANVRLMDYFNWKRVAIVYDFLETGGLYVKVWPNIKHLLINLTKIVRILKCT